MSDIFTTYDILNILAKNYGLECYKAGDTNTNRRTNEYLEVPILLYNQNITTINFDIVYRTLKSDTTRFVEFFNSLQGSRFPIKTPVGVVIVRHFWMDITNTNIDDNQRVEYTLNATMQATKMRGV